MTPEQKAEHAAPKTFGVLFTSQIWNGDTLVSEVSGLSYDAAREVAFSIPEHLTGRIMSEAEDYCEVSGPSGFRQGTFSQTVLVHIVPESSSSGD